MRLGRLISVSVALVMIVSATALVLVASPARAATYQGAKDHFDGTVPGERSGAATLLIHLGMTGSLRVWRNPPPRGAQPPPGNLAAAPPR